MQRLFALFRAVASFVLALLALCTTAPTSSARPQATPNVFFVDAGITLPGNGSSWSAAMATIEDAIAAASSGDQIWVKEGTYLPNGPSGTIDGYFVTKGLSFYGGFRGTEPSQQPPAPSGSFDATIIDPVVGSRSFTIIAASSVHRVEIHGFKIANGDSSNCMNGPALGGAIYCVNTELLLADCNVVHNRAPLRGGGLYFSDLSEAGSWTLNIKRSTFDDNRVNEGKGGAIFGSFLTAGDVANTVFSQNQVQVSGDGGAVYLEDMGANVLRFTNCVFWRNSANGAGARGGGMCLGESSPTGFGNAKIVNCTFVMNVVANVVNGPALFCSTSSLCELHNSILWFNTVGGGVSTNFATYSGPVVPTYCDLEGYQFSPLPPGCIYADPQFRSVAWANGLTLRSSSPCIDIADLSQLPPDILDVNDDGNTIQPMPIDLNGALREVDWGPAPDNGVTFLDMGAYEKQ